MSQRQQVQIDELYINTNCIPSMDAVQQPSSHVEGYGMKRGVLASESNNG